MWFDVVGDLLSRARCAACDGEVARQRVFCAGCSASVVQSGKSADGWLSFGHYGGALAQAVHHFKYGARVDLARPLGHLLRSVCRDAITGAELVVPVPMHPTRLVSRGYNQAALLGAHVADELRVRFAARGLERRRPTAAQAGLDRPSRLLNVAGAFAVRTPSEVRGRHVVLVDDVSTTGATLRACSGALRDACAAQVTHVVLARTLTVDALLG